MNNPSRYPEGAGPWGASPEVISSWIGPKTKLSDIFKACIDEKTGSIEALNSLCISLGLSHRFYPDTIDEDIAYFSIYLENTFFLEDVSRRITNIIINKLPEDETDNMRDFVERINTGRDNPKEAYFIAIGEIDKIQISELQKDLAHAILSMCISLGGIHGIYSFFLFCRTIGLI